MILCKYCENAIVENETYFCKYEECIVYDIRDNEIELKCSFTKYLNYGINYVTKDLTCIEIGNKVYHETDDYVTFLKRFIKILENLKLLS